MNVNIDSLRNLQDGQEEGEAKEGATEDEAEDKD